VYESATLAASSPVTNSPHPISPAYGAYFCCQGTLDSYMTKTFKPSPRNRGKGDRPVSLIKMGGMLRASARNYPCPDEVLDAVDATYKATQTCEANAAASPLAIAAHNNNVAAIVHHPRADSKIEEIALLAHPTNIDRFLEAAKGVITQADAVVYKGGS